MMGATDRFEERADDFAWCESVIKRNSKSFYRAFSHLPERKSKSVYALYAFCRAADDIVDERASRVQLDRLEDDLERFLEGHVFDAPLWRALEVVFEEFDMEERPFFDMIEGQRRDLAFRQPETLVELEDYAYYVAGSVGLMLLPILCTQTQPDSNLRDSAIALGIAMQLTNILRDVGEDLDNGRIYLPRTVLESASYTVDDFENRRVNDAFRAAWEAIARRSEELYLPMERDALALDEDSRFSSLASLFLYRGILDSVRDDGYRCFDHRSRVTDENGMRLVAAAASLLQVPARIECA